MKNIVKELHLGDEAKAKLYGGINKLAEAVGSTLGASGRSVLIEGGFGQPQVTKDGVTVANSILLDDPVENLGINLVKQAAQKTASRAGDGTTTSTVLAKAILDEFIAANHDVSFRSLKEGMNAFVDWATTQIDRRSVDLDDDLMKDVATISTNNDKELGELISEAFIKAGEHGVVTFEKSQTEKTYVTHVEGAHLDNSCASNHFFTNADKELSELDNPYIFISATEIPSVPKIESILAQAIRDKRPIVLVAELDNQVTSALAMNKLKGNISVNVINPPSFGQKRKDILQDLAFLVGAKCFDDSLGDSIDAISPDMLGYCTRVVSDPDGTVFMVKGKPEVDEKIEELQELLKDTDHPVLIDHLNRRIALLNGSVSVIYVGADTEVEQNEKYDRVEDAVHAVRAAKKDGILPGGGAALHYLAANNECMLNSSQILGWNIMKDACFAPFNKILTNAGLNPMNKSFSKLKWGEGVDVIDGKVKKMVEAGIIDPSAVTKEALKNAFSVATIILSTDVVINNARE